ncbi:hypothetical protein DXX93_09505 [Thalassotalea euphylliae]|uniref:Transposase n=1 Tax=Thalassotalea euphylliae TaxID=1655234 RepID=A0A3E0TWN8_9GAMM|nr:hypothetical protein DXX93_09505 [Thalassotalea euphylliae]
MSRSWRNNRQNVSTIFNCSQGIGRAISTTNVIESLNSVIRKAIKKRKPLKNATMPIRNWKSLDQL